MKSLTLFACAMLVTFNYLPALALAGSMDKAFEVKVRRLLSSEEWPDANRIELKAMGRSAFPVYRKFLNNPQEPLLASRVLFVLAESSENCREFKDIAVAKIADKSDAVREEATLLLGVIGTSKDAPLLVPLLEDRQMLVVMAAISSLGNIGGAREKQALLSWRKAGSSLATYRPVAEKVRVAIEKIEKRLSPK